MFSLFYIAITYWLTIRLSTLQEPYLRGLLGVFVLYFSFRALYWPIKWVKMKDFEDILYMKSRESLETFLYFLAFGLGIAEIINLVIYLFKLLMTGLDVWN